MAVWGNEKSILTTNSKYYILQNSLWDVVLHINCESDVFQDRMNTFLSIVMHLNWHLREKKPEELGAQTTMINIITKKGIFASGTHQSHRSLENFYQLSCHQIFHFLSCLPPLFEHLLQSCWSLTPTRNTQWRYLFYKNINSLCKQNINLSWYKKTKGTIFWTISSIR